MSTIQKLVATTPRTIQVGSKMLTFTPQDFDLDDPETLAALARNAGCWTVYSDVPSANPVELADLSALTAASGALGAAATTTAASGAASVAILLSDLVTNFNTLTTSHNQLITDHDALVSKHNTLTAQHNVLQDDVQSIWSTVDTLVSGLKDNDVLVDP